MYDGLACLCTSLVLKCKYKVCLHKYVLLPGQSRSFFGFGQCQAGTSGDIINGVSITMFVTLC